MKYIYMSYVEIGSILYLLTEALKILHHINVNFLTYMG